MGTTNHTLRAAVLVAGNAAIISLVDSFVRDIAAEAGLWQFHLGRSLMAVAVLLVLVPVFGLRLRPRRPWRVAARSAVHGAALLIYFGGLAFLPVALVAAGTYTAPIFVLLISRVIYGHPLGPVRVAAAATGFAGVVLVLGPQALAGATLVAVLPVLSGALYALANIATREWCAEESAMTLTAGYFTAMGILGAIGLAALSLWPVPGAEGVEGFVLRGAVRPTPTFLSLTLVQAVGSVVGVGMLIRAYQLAEAGRVSVMEYMFLPVSALWGWLLRGEVLDATAWAGMALIIGAGAAIALRGRREEIAAAAARSG